MARSQTRNMIRELRASVRDTVILLREFRKPLLLFIVLILGSGSLFNYLASQAGEPVDGLFEAFYLVLTLTFLQPGNDFPHAWYLRVFYFVMPVFGLAILAQGLTDFGILLFNRRARGKEWEMAVASTFSNHIVLIGLGHLGYRVARQLHDLNQDLVVIELDPKADLVASIRQLKIPVIEDDGTREQVLASAGVQRAQSIILCTQNDVANLQMALKARGLNPEINVIVRIFDDDFAESLHKQFGFRALSATGMAAPIFAALAAGIDITPPITINGQANSLARLVICPGSPISNQTVADIETRYNLSVVMLGRSGSIDNHPAPGRQVLPADDLAVLGSPEQIAILVHNNRASRKI